MEEKHSFRSEKIKRYQTKQLEAKMEIAKNLIKYILLSAVLSGNVYAQEFSGTYRASKSDKNCSYVLNFDKNLFVDTLKAGDVVKTIGWGTFKKLKRQLVLTYDGIERYDTSTYVSSSKEGKVQKVAQISVTVTDETKNPIQANIGLYNAELKPLSLMTADKQGFAYAIVYENPQNFYFVIDFIGYSRVTIPTKYLIGKDTELTVTLKPTSQMENITKTVTYKIERTKDRSLRLIAQDNTTLILMHDERGQ